MKLGILLPTYLESAAPQAIRESAMLAERLGYESIWVTDHVLVPSRSVPQYRSIYEAVTTLAWTASVTTRVRLGFSVIVAALRNPVVIAKQLATLDTLSEGRVVVGIGSGWVEHEFEMLGIDFRRRGQRTDETIRLLRALWTGSGRPIAEGSHVLDDYSFAPLPAQPGGPPIWIGGTSPAAYRRAAALGDAWHGGATMAYPDKLREAVSMLDAARDGQRDRPAVTLRLRIAAQGGDYLGPRGPERVIGVSGAVEELLALGEAGCSHVVLVFWEGDHERSHELMTRFAETVLPRISPDDRGEGEHA